MNITLVAENDAVYTEKIQTAINQIASSGGGKLILTGGKFLSGSIELKSNICLYLEADTTLKALGNPKDFPSINFHHNEMIITRSFIWAKNAENITLCGEGTIDFSDEHFYDLNKVTPFGFDISLLSKEEIAECAAQRKYGVGDAINQPIFFESCKNIKVRDLNLIHASFWTLTFSRCTDICVTGVNIENRFSAGNSDGIHLSASKNAVISNCNIKAGDDCVAITCITDENGVSENITITNCNFESSSAGIRLGHLYSKVRNVCVSNVNITNSNRGIAIFSKDDGHIKNVVFSNININTRLLYGSWWGKGEPIVLCAANSNGIIENITFHNIFAHSDNGMVIAGSNNIKNITIRDMKFELANSDRWNLIGNKLDIRPNSFEEVLLDEPFDKYVDQADVKFENFTSVKV